MHYVDDAVQQQPVLFIERDVAHEGPVDLDQVHREVAQIVERRVAGAEVVDGQLAARLAQRIDPHPVLIAGLHQQGLGDLDDDVRRVQPEVVDHLEPLARLRVYGLEPRVERLIDICRSGKPDCCSRARSRHDCHSTSAPAPG